MSTELLKSEILSLIDKKDKTQKQLVLKILRGIFQGTVKYPV